MFCFHAFIIIWQVFICRYIFMAMYSFVTPFLEATICGVPSSVFDKSGCAAGEKKLRNTLLVELTQSVLAFGILLV
jgi:hypothetical protein